MIALLLSAVTLTAPMPAPLPAPLVFARLSFADAQRSALASSPDVAGARARVDESRSALATARGAFGPALFSNYAQVPQGNPPGPNIISRQVTTGLQVTVGDLVSLSPTIRAATYAFAASQADELAAESTERVKVAGLYFDALKLRSIAQARRSLLTAADAQQSAARLRVKAGAAPRLDFVRARVAVARAVADAELAAAADLNATEALRVETGTRDTLADTIPGDPVPMNLALQDPQRALELARSLRPEILSARRLDDAARAGVASARAASFPALTLSGGYLVGTDSGVPINAPSVSAQLTLPFSGVAHERVVAAVARVAEARARAAGIERQIVLDVTASARSLGAAERASQATTRAREAATEELDATELGYRNGASSSLEVTSARSTYISALLDELSALYDLAKARATLNIEVGR